MSIYTWRELKQFISELSDEELEQPLNSSPHNDLLNFKPDKTKENYYQHKTEPYIEGTLEELSHFVDGSINSSFNINDYDLVIPKGTLYIYPQLPGLCTKE